MSRMIRTALQTLHQGLAQAAARPSSSPFLVAPMFHAGNGFNSCLAYGAAPLQYVPVRGVKHWVRKYRYILRALRKKEMFKYPERFAKPHPRYSFLEWNYNAEIFALGKRLGEEFNESLLKQALTDETYIHKERKKQEELGLDPALIQMQNNEELSRIGSQLANRFLLEFLQKEFPLFPAEGQNAVLGFLTSPETLTQVGFHTGLQDLILCEEYPPSQETYSRALLAMIGALHQSAGEERTRKFVIDFLASLLCGRDVNELWDIPRPWQMMVELAKERNLYPVEPRLIRDTGRNTIHAVFVIGIYDKDKKLLGTGIGETIDIAQEMAARDVLQGFFGTKEPRRPFEFQSTNFPYKLVPHVRNIHLPQKQAPF